MGNAKKRHRAFAESTPMLSFRTKDFFCFKSATAQISKNQCRALKFALEEGYYDIPRKTKISSLASKSKTSSSTFAEHLRKAESKAFRIMGEVLKKL